MYVRLASSVTLTGLTAFTNNSAEFVGGAVNVFDGGILRINGPVCAQGNTAGEIGNFLNVESATSVVILNDTVIINGNQSAAGDIVTDGSVTCGASTSSWVAGSYTIVGDACVCNNDFVNNSTTTCNSCGGLGIDASTCECAVSVLMLWAHLAG